MMTLIAKPDQDVSREAGKNGFLVASAKGKRVKITVTDFLDQCCLSQRKELPYLVHVTIFEEIQKTLALVSF